MSRLLWLLLLPSGLLLALGAGIAWAGLVLLTPWLRRLTTASAGTSVAPGLTCHRDSKPAPQPYGTAHEPSPRVPSTGEPGRSVEALGALPWNRGLHPILWTPTRPRPWVAHGDCATTTGRRWEES